MQDEGVDREKVEQVQLTVQVEDTNGPSKQISTGKKQRKPLPMSSFRADSVLSQFSTVRVFKDIIRW